MNKKNTIRLTESELKNLIAESVKNVLRENNSFHGIPNTEVNVDDEGEKILLWHGREMDYWEVENYLYREYEYEMEELNQTESEEGFELWLNAKGEEYITDVLGSLFWPQGAGYVTESTTSKIKLTETELKKIVTESVKKVLNEGYDSHPMDGYEEFDRIGEGAAYDVMRLLRSKYSNYVDETAVRRIVEQFQSSLYALVDVGNEDIGIKGFGIKYRPY